MSEKRHFRTSPRPQITCQVKALRLDHADAEQIVSYTKDIGTGGLFLENYYAFETGERVQVTLSTPSTWDPIVLEAKAVWTTDAVGDSPGGVGLQFMELSDEQTLALASFVRTLDFEE